MLIYSSPVLDLLSLKTSAITRPYTYCSNMVFHIFFRISMCVKYICGFGNVSHLFPNLNLKSLKCYFHYVTPYLTGSTGHT